MKSKTGKSSKKETKKKMTEAEREQTLVDWLVRVIIAQTLKELDEKSKDSERD